MKANKLDPKIFSFRNAQDIKKFFLKIINLLTVGETHVGQFSHLSGTQK